jgi:hypothetical protein
MQDGFSPFRGGESEALKRLRESITDKVWCITYGEFWLKKTNPAFLLSIYKYEMTETYTQVKVLWFLSSCFNILFIYLSQDLIYELMVTRRNLFVSKVPQTYQCITLYMTEFSSSL